MKLALLLLFCSLSAAVAMPPGRWWEQVENVMSDQRSDYDIPFPQFDGVRVEESHKFVQEPRGVIDQPSPSRNMNKSKKYRSQVAVIPH